jgi:hypothetical protein
MPYRKIPGIEESYFMLAVDENGIEAANDPDASMGRISDDLKRALFQEKATDLFIWIHGWKGGVNEAFDQYDRWIAAFAARSEDHAMMMAKQPGYKAIHLGFHWPSLAWGEGQLAAGDSFSAASTLPLDQLVEHFSGQLGDSPPVRAALRKLFGELRQNAADDTLTKQAQEAYLELNAALALGDSGRPGDGASDRHAFDPDLSLPAHQNLAFGAAELGSRLLSPLRQLTFWTMKKRAMTVGQQGLHSLLKRLQSASPSLHIHLMGHSFGSIVVSSAIVGPDASSDLHREIDSCVLIQGAMSLWAFASSIPNHQEICGYFNKIVSEGKVKGALIATRSKHDYAVGNIYPWAAGVANQISFGLPLYGAIGTFGICGTTNTENLEMKGVHETYALEPGKVYNVDGSDFISKIDGVSGAHSDIGGPEVAHLIWQAAMLGGVKS